MKMDSNFLGNISAIFVLDKEGNLLNCINAQNRYVDGKIIDYKNYIGKNVLDMFDNLNKDNSSIMQCIESGKPIYCSFQEFEFDRDVFYCENLTVPIYADGEMKVIEISRYLDGSPQKEDGELRHPMYQLSEIITADPQMLRNIEIAKSIKDTSSPVMIYGESGTGKELFAQGIHADSNRRSQPFIAQNCAALPENLFESLLFGSVKGAFTGAIDKPGLFELANHGTLFLDEINSLPLQLQPKLLRAVEDGKVRRIGSAKDIPVDVRIITAMNEEPLNLLEKGGIREDLFYRLNVLSLKMIPLRERKSDINLYVNHYINVYNKVLKRNVRELSPDVQKVFWSYDWPGNVRELKNVIEASMHFVSGERIELCHFPQIFFDSLEKRRLLTDERKLKEIICSDEKNMIIAALLQTKGNVSQAAKALNLPRETLRYKIQKYSIDI